MNKLELKEFLDAKVIQYNNPNFIESDPIQIPHQFSLKEDIEISAFLTATIAWGNRKSIIKNANKMMSLMWTYYIRLDIKLRDLELHQLTLNYEKTRQELQSII